VPERRRVYERLRAAGIGVQVHYVPIYRHPIHARSVCLYPECERAYAGLLSLPLHPGLTEADQDRVVAELTACLRAGGSPGPPPGPAGLPARGRGRLGGPPGRGGAVPPPRPSGAREEAVPATPADPADDAVVTLAGSLGAQVVRGPVDDVLTRFMMA